MRFDTILYETKDTAAIITLNRPDNMNAFNGQMAMDFRDALITADMDDEVRSVIVTGAGKAFCAGADLAGGEKTFKGGPGSIAPHGIVSQVESDHPRNLVELMLFLKKPIIIAFNGAAVGVGVTMVLPADIKIASEKARIGFLFSRRGTVAELSSPWLLPRQIGASKAAELMYTGRLLNAQEALEFGLVSRVVPHDELMSAAHEIAKEISLCAPVSVAVNKRMTAEWLINPPSSISEIESINTKYFTWAGQQPDAKEGIMSFLEKRDPEWKMSVNKDTPDFFK